jgi:LDH2 family malate/lactate/ureidoglycolate dehydrogenase
MFSLKNLSLLNDYDDMVGGAKSYKECKSEKISQTMREFKQGKLKNRADIKITDEKQAIAVALSQAQSKCSYAKTDLKELIDKVDRDLNQSDKKIILSNLIETKDAINELKKKGKHKRVYVYKKLLWDKIIESGRKGEELDKNMWDEIKKIHEL